MKRVFIVAVCFSMLFFQARAQERAKKALFVILDGIPADVLDSVPTPNIDRVIKAGGYTKALMGGDVGTYSQTPTISAVGYNSLLTGTWVNKHNVWGNSIKQPNYHYWTIFRYFKSAFPEKQTAIFSTWLDNRTKLVGANLPATNWFDFDYYFDGMENDTLNFPHDEERNYIHLIDEAVSKETARYIKAEAPDLSWMYLEYSDDMGHKYGNSPQMIDGVRKADVQIGRVWEAIQYREKKFDEDWLIVITTDHGREENGFGHGGQSERERTIWIATNAKQTNQHFNDQAEMVDILPSMACHLGLNIPKKYAMELDGVSFIGELSADKMVAKVENGQLQLSWKSYADKQIGRVWLATTNHFKEGDLDNYWLMGEVELGQESASFSLKGTASDIYKVVMETPSGYLNYWVLKE
ncbi:alkaline phosphatase family protein [Echinicola sp. CAU 1574]|uniref:Alkaline phosphatase family protein n=1 Tax=Echinicola arenosa TaxID=2774144 RepID=A0ABR9AMT8_9BACT|nr:alkaline phosphatase family protein [Echinicola arenosa]MBD8490123.1 alkaline phosphatase family protein [Echinicola arenosa]